MYKLSEQNRSNILILLRDAEIKGSDAIKVVKVAEILTPKKDHKEGDPFLIEMDNDLRTFILSTLNEIKIQGKFAASVVSIQIALSSPHQEEKSETKVETKAAAPIKPTKPK